MQRIDNYIGGSLCEPVSGRWLDVLEPATATFHARSPDSDAGDVAQAVDAAAAAFPHWSSLPPSARSQMLLRLADLVDSHLEDLARAESIDTGKPLESARRVDIPRASANLRFFATAILHQRTEAYPTAEGAAGGQGGRAINHVRRQPRGVAGCISPWNLPLYLLTWKIAPALATGNTVVAKPSEVTPMTAYMLAGLCIEAGLPPGVLNIVHGTGPGAGAALVAHPDVPAISFTGGTATGRAIALAAAPMFKSLSLELGGKNPNVIFADADLDDALATSLRSSFANQGQVCLCGSRMFVERSVCDRFVEAFVERTRALKIGDPLDPDTQQGALVSPQHLEKVESYITLARAEGGVIRCGGTRPTTLPERCRDGCFIEPAVITDLDVRCRTNTEEIFGPVVTITPFDDEDEVIGHANATDYGLSASIWTSDLDRAHRVAGRIDAGTVWINCWLLRDLRVPFGGMKHSGLGREGGDEALRFFTEPKTICIRLRGGEPEPTT